MQQYDLLSKRQSTVWPGIGWAFWAIAALFYGYEFLHRVAPSVLTTQLREAFAVNDHQLGVIGAMYFYAYASFQLPAGIIIDRFGAKKCLTIASAILTVGSFIFTIASNSPVAQLSRFMIGMGSAFAFVGCLKIGAETLSTRSFPLVVGLTNLCGTLGALLGGLPLTYWVERSGWRITMLEISFVGLLITIMLWLLLPNNPEVKASSKPKAVSQDLLAGLKLVLKCRQSWLISLYGALLVAPIAALPEMWGVEYLKVAFQLTSMQAASITHTIFIGTAIGGPIIGWLVYYLPSQREFMLFATVGALILLSIFLYWLKISPVHFYPILVGYGILTANMLLCFSWITQIHPPWAQGAAIGFTNMVIMAGAGLSQQGIGWILHRLRASHQGLYLVEDYHIAFSVLPICLFIAILLILFSRHSKGLRA